MCVFYIFCFKSISLNPRGNLSLPVCVARYLKYTLLQNRCCYRILLSSTSEYSSMWVHSTELTQCVFVEISTSIFIY